MSEGECDVCRKNDTYYKLGYLVRICDEYRHNWLTSEVIFAIMARWFVFTEKPLNIGRFMESYPQQLFGGCIVSIYNCLTGSNGANLSERQDH
jgi:hypothetical protein